MPTLMHALGTRRQRAARRALEVARRVDTPGSTGAELALEEALGDLRHYTDLYRTLEPVAGELGVYRRGGADSVVGDLLGGRDGRGQDRLTEHQRALGRDQLEQRAIGTGALSGVVVPQYLVDDAAPHATKIAPLTAMFGSPLPDEGMTVDLAGWTTEPTGAVQSSENTAATASDPNIGVVPLNVRTAFVRCTISLQSLDRARMGIDDQLVPLALAVLDALIDDDIVNGSGGAGHATGIRNTASVSAATYTDATPTIGELWPILEGLVRTCETAHGLGGSPILLAHPRRISWLRQQVVAENLSGLELDEPAIPGAALSLFGNVHVIASPAIPTNLGAGTNQDALIVLSAPDVLDLFVGTPTILTTSQSQAGSAGVEIVVARYYAFTAARLPAAIGQLTGTGLVPPTP